MVVHTDRREVAAKGITELVSFDHRMPFEFDGIFVNLEHGLDSAPLSWVARDRKVQQIQDLRARGP